MFALTAQSADGVQHWRADAPDAAAAALKVEALRPVATQLGQNIWATVLNLQTREHELHQVRP